MVELGDYNHLTIIKLMDFGAFLDGGEIGDILLPRRYVKEDAQIGDKVKVFVFLDSNDDYIATTQQPFAKVGEFASLRVKDVNKVGAFLDWGLSKDIMVPFGEQKPKMEAGRNYLVFLYVDNTNRIAASGKVDKFLNKNPRGYKAGDEVQLLTGARTELGYKAIINNDCWGLIHHGDVFKNIRFGSAIKGYIKQVREDGKIDLTLQKPGYGRIEDQSTVVLKALHEENGFLPLNDKSSPDAISQRFGCSKKTFKTAVGKLYKERLIEISDDGIRLTQKGFSQQP